MSLITLKNCDIIDDAGRVLLKDINFSMGENDAYLITGDNSSGKKYLLDALCGKLIVKATKEGAQYLNAFSQSVVRVSLEDAAALIHTERQNDESDYIPSGLDIGRTARKYIAQAFIKDESFDRLPPMMRGKANSNSDIESALDTLPEVRLCGVEGVLDRGLKYLSTGEVRRVMLCRAILSGVKLLILSDVYSGLDVSSRKIISGFIDNIIARQLNDASGTTFPHIIFCSGRYSEIPCNITHVLEFTSGTISFYGARGDYEALLNNRKNLYSDSDIKSAKEDFLLSIKDMARTVRVSLGYDYSDIADPLIEMKNVNVAWGDHKVLRQLYWTVNIGEHYLITGPNGSGKTTLLELITGDNGQVFSNDVKLFGKYRGPDLTIWDLKHLLGIVSYRVHVEYRMLRDTIGRDVVISGFHDSIGLYERPSDVECAAALKWLEITGLKRLFNTPFGTMSYGEQRALLIVRAAVKCPPIMILDEPCHALDESNRAMVLELLENIASLGTSTLLHVTHEADEVLKCCHHRLELLPDGEPMWKCCAI